MDVSREQLQREKDQAMFEPMYRRPAKNGNEQDAFSRKARKHLASLQRAGVVHATKTLAARRDRRTSKQNLRQYAF